MRALVFQPWGPCPLKVFVSGEGSEGATENHGVTNKKGGHGWALRDGQNCLAGFAFLIFSHIQTYDTVESEHGAAGVKQTGTWHKR